MLAIISSMRGYRFSPSLLGASASIAFGAVSGTALFNLIAWLTAGSGISFAEAYSAVPHNRFYLPLSLVCALISGLLSGLVAAKLSRHRPYLNALVSSVLVLVWSIVLIASPLREITFDTLTLVDAFVLPAPSAVLGAYIFLRWGNDG